MPEHNKAGPTALILTHRVSALCLVGCREAGRSVCFVFVVLPLPVAPSFLCLAPEAQRCRHKANTDEFHTVLNVICKRDKGLPVTLLQRIRTSGFFHCK